MIAEQIDGWWLSYDISSDRARKAQSDALSGHGWRYQYSGFVLPPLTAGAVVEIVDAGEARLGLGDSLLALRWCERCFTHDKGNGIEVVPHRWVSL